MPVTKNYTIDDMRKLARNHGGECLSIVYIYNKAKMRWRCKDNHEWETTAKSILRGCWCKRCASKKAMAGKRLTIKEMVAIANKKNGKCLSENYVNNNTKLKWECEEGHRWIAIPNNIKTGQWCPYCKKTSLQEEKCRYVFEWLTNSKFPKKSINDRQFLDGYCEELNLAFEYGEQHFRIAKNWNTNEEQIQRQQSLDRIKTNKCKKRGIDLIRINYSEKNNLFNFISSALYDRGIEIKSGFSWDNFWTSNYYKKQNNLSFNKCRSTAQNRGGRLLSSKFKGWHTKLRWTCFRGHIWEADPDHVIRGQWCPFCAGRRKTIKDMYDLAKKKNGRCLSSIYKTTHTKLLCECSENHTFEMRPSCVLRNQWCPVCFKNRKKLNAYS